jgi:hypothetical protein
LEEAGHADCFCCGGRCLVVVSFYGLEDRGTGRTVEIVVVVSILIIVVGSAVTLRVVEEVGVTVLWPLVKRCTRWTRRLELSYVVLEAVTLDIRVAVTLDTDVGVLVTVINAGVSMHVHTAAIKEGACDLMRLLS